MRVIRPADHRAAERRRGAFLGAGLLSAGLLVVALVATIPVPSSRAVGATAVAAAMVIGVGIAWLHRSLSRDPRRIEAQELERLVADIFDDSYVLILSPRLPRVRRQLAGLLVGPAGIRALTVRRWMGRYRVRGRAWEYDTRGRRGWIACRTNPSFEAGALRDAVVRWAESTDQSNLPIEATIAFPRSHTEVVLEEPSDEIVTADNAPWWAQRIGRAQRLDPVRAARFVEAVMEAAERESSGARMQLAGPRQRQG